MKANDIQAQVTIRLLTSGDWVLWKEIRLEALKCHPEAFGGSYEDESQYEDDIFKQMLLKNTIFGIFVKEELAGVAGFSALGFRKTCHRANLFGVYLKEAYRGQGLADKLIEAVITHAKTKVLQLHCSVVTSNLAAIKLYQKHGFKIYGTEPRSLKVDHHYYDEHLMVSVLDQKSA